MKIKLIGDEPIRPRGTFIPIKDATMVGMENTMVIPAKNFMRSSAIFGRLPEMYRTIGQLQREIEELKKELNK